MGISKLFFKDILEYLDMDENEFNKTIDSFRPDHLWKKQDRNGNLSMQFGSNKNEKGSNNRN